MRLTPLDIRKQEFKKAMRGLDSDEVYAFLSTIADEYEAVINDNKALRERLLELDDKVQEYRNMEKTLRDTLLTAERVTVEAKENARREADLVVKEAQIEAEKAVRDIKNTSMKLRQEIQALRQQKDSYLSRLRLLVESHMKFVESAETDFVEEERKLESEQRELDAKKQAIEEDAPRRGQRKGALDEVIERQKAALDNEVPPSRQQTVTPDTPVSDRSAQERAAVGQPTEGRSTAVQPTTGEPTTEQTAAARPTTGEPTTGQPTPERATATQTAPGRVVAEPVMPTTPPASPPSSSEQTVPQEPQPPSERGATPGDGPGTDWSLEKLRRDILTGSMNDDESGR